MRLLNLVLHINVLDVKWKSQKMVVVHIWHVNFVNMNFVGIANKIANTMIGVFVYIIIYLH